MSSTEWMIASHVTCDETSSRIGRVAVVDLRVLEPDAGKALDDPSVERRVGTLVDDRPRVVALEVDGVHAAELAELRDELVRPVARRVELEAQRGVVLEPALDGLQRRRLAEPHRHHVRERAKLAPDGLSERLPGLAEREVERSALESPAAIVDVHVSLGRVLEERLRLRGAARTSRSSTCPRAEAPLRARVARRARTLRR